MNASFGIDHPLLATHDINALRDLLIAMGFNMTAIGKHPWGTSTSLAMFDGCLLEIMGIYDDTLIDQVPAGDFRFGRHVYEHLQHREGVALTALHSTNSKSDAAHAESAGFTVAGHLEFGRDVTLPNGTTGRTKTTLALLPDETCPRLSFFLCQQHRPDLIYVPQWLEHPNRVTGICGVNIVAQTDDHPMLKTKFSGLYDTPDTIDGGFVCDTANGKLRVLDPMTYTTTIAALPTAMNNEQSPFIAGMDFMAMDTGRLCEYLNMAGIEWLMNADVITITNAERTANTCFRFFRA